MFVRLRVQPLQSALPIRYRYFKPLKKRAPNAQFAMCEVGERGPNGKQQSAPNTQISHKAWKCRWIQASASNYLQTLPQL